MFRFEVAQDIKWIILNELDLEDTYRKQALEATYVILNYLDGIKYPSTVEDEAYQGHYPKKENI